MHLLSLAACLPLVTSPSLSPAAGDSLPTEVTESFTAGLELLLGLQEGQGESRLSEWPYEGVYRERGEIPIGYRVGGTSIVAWCLLDIPAAEGSQPGEPNEVVDAALGRALEFVLVSLDKPTMAEGFNRSYDVRGWGHAYALQFLLRLRELERVPRKSAKHVNDAIATLVETLEATAIVENGGWNYSRRGGGKKAAAPSTFMTASTLQALFSAKAMGESVNSAVIESALDRIEEARLDNDAFQYGSRTSSNARGTDGFNHVAGSTGRSPICETTLLLAGRGDLDRVRGAIGDFFEHWQALEDRRRKTGTHKRPYMIAPYYFFYAHYYCAQAIELLPEAEREEWRTKLRERFFEVRDGAGGGWNDRVFDRSENFGTAMTLLAFSRPLHAQPAGWSSERKRPKQNTKDRARNE